ncbi:MAG: hypothetical protein ABIH00_00440 [Armatimonadota bacterium]
MRNKLETKISKIMSLVENLPYFTIDDISAVESDKTYLKILFSRYKKSGRIINLKKGVYVCSSYTDKLKMHGLFSSYIEFVSNILYSSSYISLDYILYKHNILTEIPINFTCISLNKTKVFSNNFGRFFYHKIKDKLFCGFKIIKEGKFAIYKATKAKALFDYLYLRKNILKNKESIDELRLNMSAFNKKDLSEFKKYLKIENSKKMKEIFNLLIG